MKPGPVQLLHLVFRKVLVEIDDRRPFEVERIGFFDVFNFEGVTFKTKVGFEELTENSPSGDGARVFQVNVDLAVDNENVDPAQNQAPSPYLLDLRASALVRIPQGAEQLGPPRDLAVVNGASMVWSAFREQLSSLTSRMARGPAMLPTVHFHDLKTAQAVSASSAPAVKTSSKKRAPKTAAAE